jgi:DNA-binding MarR family transcriptional regulator
MVSHYVEDRKFRTEKEIDAFVTHNFFVYGEAFLWSMLEAIKPFVSVLGTPMQQIVADARRSNFLDKEAALSYSEDKKRANWLRDRRIDAYQKALKGESDEEGMSGSAKKPSTTIKRAKAEATDRRRKDRANKRGHTIYITDEQNNKLRAIAAAKDRNVQAFLEELVQNMIDANEHLVPMGEKKLREGKRPLRLRSRELAEENARLRAQLKRAGFKPS